MQKSDCKICRRVGAKLFLKGERCSSAKCAMVKRPYPPGIKKKKVRGRVSEYGKELIEKQKLRNWYNLSEKQFRNYIKKILEKRGKVEDAGQLLIKKLESRLDSVIFSMGLASSRAEARQIVSHGHFLINKRRIDIPSYEIKKGDKIKLRSGSAKREKFKNALEKKEFPEWVKRNLKENEWEIIREPFVEESSLPAEVSSIFEYYSR